MRIINAVCTIIGMRPYRLSPESLETYFAELLHILEEEIRKSVFLHYNVFQTGMSMGVDIWAAELICSLKKEFPDIRLRCVLPCETQANYWSDEWRDRYFNVLASADEVICLQGHYTKGCFHRRNIEMLSESSRLIAVHNSIVNGGISHAIDYAAGRQIDTVVLRPDQIAGVMPPATDETIMLECYRSSQISSVYASGSAIGISAIKSAWS